MHNATKALLSHASKACTGSLCAADMHNIIDEVMAKVRDGQAELRQCQDNVRAMVVAEPDRTLRNRLEPYAQVSRGIDRELETFAGGAIRLLDLLVEFEQMHTTTCADVEAGLADGRTTCDLGTYQLDEKRMRGVPAKVAEEVAAEVYDRVLAWLERQRAAEGP